MIIRAQPTAGPRQARDREWADTPGWVGGSGGPWPAAAVAGCIFRLTCGVGLLLGPVLLECSISAMWGLGKHRKRFHS